jgi:hypothetical protein
LITTHINTVPSVKDEVNRKAFATMEWLFASHQRGDMDARQFNTGVDSLFMATSGLVDEEMMGLMHAAGQLVDSSLPIVKRHFFKSGKVLTLLWGSGQSTWTATETFSDPDTGGKTRIKTESSAEAAKEKLDQMALMLLMRGYEEL